jgi:hypothetical protein
MKLLNLGAAYVLPKSELILSDPKPIQVNAGLN